jgi:hypothetical protein
MYRGGSAKWLERRWTGQEQQARAAWVLASDLAADALDGDVRKVVLRDGGGRGRTVDDLTAACRKVACYLAVTVADVSPPHLAKASGLHRRTIQKHCEWVEDQRDRPEMNGLIERLERELVGMCARVVLANLAELDGLDAEGAAA